MARRFSRELKILFPGERIQGSQTAADSRSRPRPKCANAARNRLSPLILRSFNISLPYFTRLCLSLSLSLSLLRRRMMRLRYIRSAATRVTAVLHSKRASIAFILDTSAESHPVCSSPSAKLLPAPPTRDRCGRCHEIQ
jgi:hypothetical protein